MGWKTVSMFSRIASSRLVCRSVIVALPGEAVEDVQDAAWDVLHEAGELCEQRARGALPRPDSGKRGCSASSRRGAFQCGS